ncbi:MAG TPA: winged helix DNA-binding domain-containing protein [Anaerolineales bacterium]|nr:winged helix DNA-binding domain-containing protein [Anaerolineales bacterium]
MKADRNTLKAWRLGCQKLVPPCWQRPQQVAIWLGGVQAQDYRWARWSLGLRTEGCTDEQVLQAIAERQIVRTWMFRGTLHFVAAADLFWLTALLAPGITRRNERRYRQLGLDNSAFSKSQQVLRRALEISSSLTRAEIKKHFEMKGVPAEGQQVPYLLQRAALEGLICQGIPHGGEPTYTLISDWIGTGEMLDRAEAMAALARRYFASHGPATLQDFAWWSGLTAREARQAIESVPEIVPVEVDGIQYWATSDPPTASPTESSALLPAFDEYLLGYQERSVVLDPAYAKRVNAGGGMLKPTVMVNGEIVAIWSHTEKQHALQVSIQPFRELASCELDLIAGAVNRFSSYRSLPSKVEFAGDFSP